MKRLALASLVAALAGCAHLASPVGQVQCGPDGTTRWARYETAHVALDSDLEPALARELAVVVEQARAALRQAVFPAVPDAQLRVIAQHWVFEGGSLGPARLEVTAAAERASESVVRDAEGAYLWLGMRAGDPRDNVKLPKDRLSEGERQVATRGVARLLALRAIPGMDWWLEDGLSGLYQTARLGPEGLTVGILHQDTLRSVRAQGPLPVSELLRLDRCERIDFFEALRIQPTGVLLLHMLSASRPAALAGYLGRLARGEDPTEAWKAEIQGTAAGLDAELAAYAAQDRFRGATYPFTAQAGAPTSRPLGCAEVRNLRLEGFRRLGDTKRLAKDADLALAAAPGDPAALLARAVLAPPEARVAALRELVAAEPESADAWIRLAEALPAGPERTAALAHVAPGAALPPAAEGRLAALRLAEGAVDEAVARASRAVEAAPWTIEGGATLARGLARQGRCAEARAAWVRAAGSQRALCRETAGEPVAAALAAARADVAGCAPRAP